MSRLRMVAMVLVLMAALFVGSGVAFAGVEWCDWGCPPPMEAGMVTSPKPGMVTPQFKDPNGKFTVDQSSTKLPPGTQNASTRKP